MPWNLRQVSQGLVNGVGSGKRPSLIREVVALRIITVVHRRIYAPDPDVIWGKSLLHAIRN
jgi:hypothetical protein